MTRMLSSARTHCGVNNVFGPNAAAAAIAHPNSRLFHTSGVGDMASGLFLDGQLSILVQGPVRARPLRPGRALSPVLDGRGQGRLLLFSNHSIPYGDRIAATFLLHR